MTAGGKENNRVYPLSETLTNYVILSTNTTGKELAMFVDSGSHLTLLKSRYVNMNDIDNLDKVQIIGVTSGKLSSLGSTIVKFYIKGQIFEFRVQIMDDDFPIATDGIIGRDFLQYFKVVVSYDDHMLFFGENLYIPIYQFDTQYQVCTSCSITRIWKQRFQRTIKQKFCKSAHNTQTFLHWMTNQSP